MSFANSFADDQSGATAIEYGLIAALIATILVAAMATVSPALTGAFESVAEKFPIAG
jgi:pilus assembly protein Flp/PilA